jgi:hypothetical protein
MAPLRAPIYLDWGWLMLGHLGVLAAELERTHPGAGASLREGLEETVTRQRLGVDEQLWRTLPSTSTGRPRSAPGSATAAPSYLTPPLTSGRTSASVVAASLRLPIRGKVKSRSA